MSNLQPNCCLEFDFRKVDQHAGGKWLIHDTKRRKDNQLQSLKLPCSWVARCDIKGSVGTVLNPIFSKKVQGQQGKSEGFDSCDWPSNLKLDSNREFFRPCDREIWWMTLQNNKAALLCYFKLCASFRSHWWIQIRVTVRKRPIWVKLDDF